MHRCAWDAGHQPNSITFCPSLLFLLRTLFCLYPLSFLVGFSLHLTCSSLEEEEENSKEQVKDPHGLAVDCVPVRSSSKTDKG